MQRQNFDKDGTPGQLSLNGSAFCFTLERPDVSVDPTNPHPCIPAGTYKILLQYSPHFGRTMPHLQDVPGREGILLHFGNYVSDSEGCILVGRLKADKGAAGYFLPNSRTTFDELYAQMQNAQEAGIEIEVVNPATEAT